MKLITFVVPSYNSENYLNICLDSLVKGGDEVEILVIDDGSKDSTLKIAKEYEARYPSIIKAIHQENKGHGGAINNALTLASGKYFKVVDSDDWVNADALNKLLEQIKINDADLFLTNYVYYYGYDEITKIIKFNKVLKENSLLTWKEFGRLHLPENITLHSCMYKTSILRECNLLLPEKRSYEDNYMVYLPLPKVQTLCYVNCNLYCYLIGREGQSVSLEVSLRKYKDYLLIAKLVFEAFDIYEYKNNKKLYRTLFHHLRLNFMISTIFTRLNKGKDKEFFAFLKELKKVNKKQYLRLRYFSLYFPLTIPTFIGRFILKIIYFISHKVVRFN